MAQSNNTKEWNPIEPVRRVLRDVLLSDGENPRFDENLIEEYGTIYEMFRKGDPNEILRFPESVLKSREWYKKLFSPQGSVKQINLDNIGKDFLCMIYLTEVVRELFRNNQVDSLYRFLIDGERESCEHTNRDNSLIIVETLDNFLRVYGWDLTIPQKRERFILFTDPPKRGVEYMFPIEMIVDTSRFSKLVRIISVALQETKKYEEIRDKINPDSVGLPQSMIIPSKGEGEWETKILAMTIAINREFRLWDKYRKFGFPSLRQISKYTGFPYSGLLAIRDHKEETNHYKGTDLLHRIPVRVADRLMKELIKRDRGGMDKLKTEKQ